MSSVSASTDNWAETLARFLRQEAGVEAVRIDTATRKVAVATLGDINTDALEARLAETLQAVEKQLGKQAEVPPGFVFWEDGSVKEVSEVSCETAPKFWKWKEFEWPEVETEAGHEEESEWKELAVLAAGCAVFGLAGFVVERAGFGPSLLHRILYGIALLAGGWDAAKDSWENIKERKLDIHFLMLSVAIGAVSIGAWSEAVLLLFLFSSSGAMEEYAMHRTQSEIGSLLKTAPKTAALILPTGNERTIRVEEIGIGDRLRVKPGEAFAADGVVVRGKSASDESAITGEARPVEKATGDKVFSGTINLWGVVDFEVRRLPSESTLQKIIHLIRNAQKLRAPSERFTDKFGGGYTLIVLGLCAVMFLVWWLGFQLPPFNGLPGTPSAFYRAMTLLVVMSPCALVLSIPSAILAAIAWGAKHGVLFRGGAAIEKLAGINVVALDKTGTVTTGELRIVSVESFPAGRETEILELAAALEANSKHPLARAITRHAKANGIRELDTEDFESITGQGLRGSVGGAQILLGRRELLERGPLAEWARSLPLAPAEMSEVWVLGRDVVGRILLRDEIRQESRAVIDELKRKGVRLVMLTGDRTHAAEDVAKEIGIEDVRAALTPEGKVEAIQSLRAGGKRVAMVGDGVNDAPSLAAADVSVAMGARGSDAALEQAEVILMHDRIENFLAAHRLSQRARQIILQNLAISLGVVVVMALASVGTAVPLGIGVAAHEGSTVIVCLNSLRLLFGTNR
ncbi:MAG TPA: cation-translocating P-type ATPase [Opitutaceae bacterium]|nr:cation-translocating P-type ATPase [Opitutaceae bacterium]